LGATYNEYPSSTSGTGRYPTRPPNARPVKLSDSLFKEKINRQIKEREERKKKKEEQKQKKANLKEVNDQKDELEF
jgi:hypothetical protein